MYQDIQKDDLSVDSQSPCLSLFVMELYFSMTSEAEGRTNPCVCEYRGQYRMSLIQYKTILDVLHGIERNKYLKLNLNSEESEAT